MKYVTRILLLLIGFNLSAQDALIIKKNETPQLEQANYKYRTTGFYLYQNAFYQIELQSGKLMMLQFLEVNEAQLVFRQADLSKIQLTFEALDKLWLLADVSLGVYEKINLTNHAIKFIPTESPKSFLPHYKAVFKDEPPVEMYPFVDYIGYQLAYRENERVHVFNGQLTRIKMSSEFDQSYIMGFPLIQKVNEINGISLAFWLDKNVDKPELVVNGLNLVVEPFSPFLLTLHGGFTQSDKVVYANMEAHPDITINGVSLAGSLLGAIELHGVSIAAYNFVAVNKGIMLSGVSSVCKDTYGLNISGIRNQAVNHYGIQIGLLNSAKNLRGLQIGLWNKNAKRSLPLINWQFKG